MYQIGDKTKYKGEDLKVLFWDGIPTVRYHGKLVKLTHKDDTSTDNETMQFNPKPFLVNDLGQSKLGRAGTKKQRQKLQKLIDAIITEGGTWELQDTKYIGKCKGTELILYTHMPLSEGIVIPLTK